MPSPLFRALDHLYRAQAALEEHLLSEIIGASDARSLDLARAVAEVQRVAQLVSSLTVEGERAG